MSDVFNEEWISAYFDGEVSPEEAARFEASLDQHPERAKALEELRQLRSSIQSLPTHRIPERSGDKSFEQRVLSVLPIAASAESQRPALSIHEEGESHTRSGNGAIHGAEIVADHGGNSTLDSSTQSGEHPTHSDSPVPSDSMEPFGVIQHWRFALGTVASVAALILISFILSPAVLDPVDGPAVALHDGERVLDETESGDGDNNETFETMSSGDGVSSDRIDDLESNSGMHKSDIRRSGFRPGREVQGEYLRENETAEADDEMMRFEADTRRQLNADDPQNDPSNSLIDGNQSSNESQGMPADYPNQDTRDGQSSDFRQRNTNGRNSDGSTGYDSTDGGQSSGGGGGAPVGGGSPGGGGSPRQNAGIGGADGGPGGNGPGAGGPGIPGPGERLESQQDRSGASEDDANPSRGGRDASNQRDPRANGFQNNSGSQSENDTNSNNASDQSNVGNQVGGGFGGGGSQSGNDASPSSDGMDERNGLAYPHERNIDSGQHNRFYSRNGDFGFEFRYGDPFPLYRQLTEDRFNAADPQGTSQYGMSAETPAPQNGFIAVAEIDPFRNRLYVEEIRGRRRSMDAPGESADLDDAYEKRGDDESTRELQDNELTQRSREVRGSDRQNNDRRVIDGDDDSRNSSGDDRSDDGRGNRDGIRELANEEGTPGTRLGGQTNVESVDRFGDDSIAPGNQSDGHVDFLFEPQLGLESAIEASEALDDLMESVLRGNDILEGKPMTLDISSEATDRDARLIELARLQELNFQLETQTNWRIDDPVLRSRQRGWGLSERESNSSDGETTTDDLATDDLATDESGIEESRTQESYYRDEFGRSVEAKTAMLGNEFIVYQWYRIEADAAAVNGLIQDLDALGISVDMYYQHAFQPIVGQPIELSDTHNAPTIDADNDVGDSLGATEGGDGGDDADADPSSTRLQVQGTPSAPQVPNGEERRLLGRQQLGPDDLALVPRTSFYEDYQQLAQVAPESQGQSQSAGQDAQDDSVTRDIRETNTDAIEQIESVQDRPNESDADTGVGNGDQTNLNAHVTDLARGNYFERGSRVFRTNPVPIVSFDASNEFSGGERQPGSDNGNRRLSDEEPQSDDGSLADPESRVGGDTASDSGDSAEAASGDNSGSAPPDDGQSSEGRQTGQRFELEESTTEQQTSGFESGEKPIDLGSEQNGGWAIASQPLRNPNFVVPQFKRDGRVQLVIILAHRHRPPVRIVSPPTVEQVAPDEQ